MSPIIDPRFSYIRIEIGGKKPVDRWRGQVRADLDVVKRWVDNGYNLGVLTSRASGVWVLDIDLDAEGNPSPEWRKLLWMYGMPETLTVRTPSGGIHYYLRQPSDFTVKNDQGLVVAPGVDIRGEGGYVLAPGSRVSYEKHGKHYEGEYEVVSDAPVAPAPQWLLERLKEREEIKQERESRVVRERVAAKPKIAIKGDDWDKMAREELNRLFAQAAQLARLPEGKKLEINGKLRGWEDGNGFFALACQIIAIARWPRCTVTVQQAHDAWKKRVPPHYRVHTWEYALDSADPTWEHGDRERDGQEADSLFGF